MLTSCEIAQLADDVALVQTSSVTLSRASSASDGLGGRSNALAAHLTALEVVLIPTPPLPPMPPA
jgi:hypothetical protein